MIKDGLIPELEKKFGTGSFQTGESPIIVFAAKHPEVGDVQIWDDGDQATLSVGDITYGHFNPYDRNLTQNQADHEATESVIDFLDALFSDKVLL
ncbi:MAG: hypothetical protein ACYTBJ_06065 [Planctomycetota bacterium]|jgi:hypothetical protein